MIRQFTLWLTCFFCFNFSAIAGDQGATMDEQINSVFEPIVGFLAKLIFWKPFAFIGIELPIVVIWLVVGAIFFTIKMKFINISGFRHALDLVRGKYDNPNDKGEVSHFQALVTALSGTVGLGNIAGVAVAVTIGGPGATFWMIVAGLLGMSSKFVECTLGVKYRNISEDGEVSGGPMYYLSKGLSLRGKAGLGKVLAAVFAVLCIGGSFGGGNMFQANQAFAQLSSLHEFSFLEGKGVIFGCVLALLVGIVIIGGIKSIAKVTDKIVPFMVGLYVLFSVIIIGMNITEIGEAFSAIFSGAFSPDAAKGGIIGVLIVGFQRAAFSNEAGVGSASIAHSAAKTDEPVSEGIVAVLEPFVDTVVICTMTALVLIFTGFANPNGDEYISKLSEQYVLDQAVLDNQSTSLDAYMDSLSFTKGQKIFLNTDSSKTVLSYNGLNKGFSNLDSLQNKPLSAYTVDQISSIITAENGVYSDQVDMSNHYQMNFVKDYVSDNSEKADVLKNGEGLILLVLRNSNKGVELHGIQKNINNGQIEMAMLEKLEGARLTSVGFSSVFPWFKYVLMIAIVLFAFSTMISWSYYGLKSWTYLFGKSNLSANLYKLVFLLFIVIGSSSSLGAVIDFSDMMILGMAFPNILGLYFMAAEVKKDMGNYWKRIKSGEIKRYK